MREALQSPMCWRSKRKVYRYIVTVPVALRVGPFKHMSHVLPHNSIETVKCLRSNTWQMKRHLSDARESTFSDKAAG